MVPSYFHLTLQDFQFDLRWLGDDSDADDFYFCSNYNDSVKHRTACVWQMFEI